MAHTKSAEFRPDEVEMAVIAKALGHPARIAILKLLSGRTGCVCGEIVHRLPLSQSTVSQHLQALKNARLIISKIHGSKVYYRVDSRTCDMALNQFHYMLNRARL